MGESKLSVRPATVANQVKWFYPESSRDHGGGPNGHLGKHLVLIIGDLIPHDVKRSSGQFVGQRFSANGFVGRGGFAVIKLLDLWVVTNRGVGRFHIGPG